MICEDLARTGTDPVWLVILLLALGLVAFGLALRHRARRRALGVALLLACLVGASTLGAVPSAQAACPTPPRANSLTLVQTSVNTDLSPDEPPSPIAGRVTNTGPDETYVAAVVVSIGVVVKAAGAASGACDASDYVLIDPRMPVAQHLAANGGSAPFTGALIGFLDKPTNQDACKGATVHLIYATA